MSNIIINVIVLIVIIIVVIVVVVIIFTSIVLIIIIPSFQLSHFKIPRYIEFVDEFPTTVTGKIQKFVMR